MLRKALTILAFALFACGGSSPTEPAPAVITPACANPATLINAENRAHPDRFIDEYIVMFREGIDVPAESARLASKYGFTVRETFWIIPGFLVDLDPHVVAKLRCEPTVAKVQFGLTNIPPP